MWLKECGKVRCYAEHSQEGEQGCTLLVACTFMQRTSAQSLAVHMHHVFQLQHLMYAATQHVLILEPTQLAYLHGARNILVLCREQQLFETFPLSLCFLWGLEREVDHAVHLFPWCVALGPLCCRLLLLCIALLGSFNPGCALLVVSLQPLLQ